MTQDEITNQMIALSKAPGFPDFNGSVMGDALASELADNWDNLPESTKAIMLGVATALKKQFADELISGIKADMAMAKAMGVQPDIMLVDHTFTFIVTHLPDDGVWMAECDALYTVTEAKTYDAVVARALEIAGEMAIENGIMHPNETMSINFVQTQSSVVTV